MIAYFDNEDPQKDHRAAVRCLSIGFLPVLPSRSEFKNIFQDIFAGVTIPRVLLFLLFALAALMTVDTFWLSSQYLYFSSEMILLLTAAAIYSLALNGNKWNDALTGLDRTGAPLLAAHLNRLKTGFYSLVLLVLFVWMASGIVTQKSFSDWFRTGQWFLFYLFNFTVFYLLIRKQLRRINLRALLPAVFIVQIILTGYEIMMLDNCDGWQYNQTVIAWLGGIPFENIVFIYPVAPAFCMLLYTVFRNRFNPKKAVWVSIAILFPVSVILELISIFPLNFWEVYNRRSILPLGQTNIEEFIYYFIFQLLSISIYVFFDMHVKTATEATSAVGSPLKRFFSPAKICLYLVAPVLILMAFDVMQMQSRYLYLTTEIVLVLGCMGTYFYLFRNKHWQDAREQRYVPTASEGALNAHVLRSAFVGLGAVTAMVWVLAGITDGQAFAVWLKSGHWYLFYCAIFFSFALLVRNKCHFVHLKALLLSCFFCLIVLWVYEALLLFQGTGWQYNQTVIGWVLGVPVENLLFIYPVAPALNMILYSLFRQKFNDVKAFWYLMALIVPAAMIVELIGIYPLNLWEIFNRQSIWPMGQTNFEEFLYYIIFQFMSVLVYLFFTKQLTRFFPARPQIAG